MASEVYRIYVEKRPGLDAEARALFADLAEVSGVSGLSGIRLLNRYDVDNIDSELFETSVKTVFSEPQLDVTYRELQNDGARIFAVEYLPGQFDQRADSAAQCIQLISQCERPRVRTAKVYMLYGENGSVSDESFAAVRKYVINPVECREASLELPETLAANYEVKRTVETLNGFISLDDEKLAEFIKKYGLAMDIDDIRFCRDYFVGEKRDPTITEIRMIDTYWSDHCRHTTFLTTIDEVKFEDPLIEAAYNRYIETRRALGRTKPVNLMDIATLAAKYLKSVGKLNELDESDEINACTVKFKMNTDKGEQDWLLLFKNETHNHPTEIEPFGGAATCIGGAIRDPLSGRAYVYAAMRVTGAGDPLKPISQTLEGKLPQKKLVKTAAAGYSSYGNQIGLATGQVDEIYNEGYVAKRMEIGAVLGAVPEANVRRECPDPGDVVILLGGRTGRDGCGGATGSSKSHTLESLESCGAEVQKGNAPEERKLQRLFRDSRVSKLIKRCNDFGAGGVSVAIGELADGLHINLDAVPKKYEGLDGTELAISESQERMAVVVAPDDAARFMELARGENIEATEVARVTEEPRLVMSWNGVDIVDISREFLNSNGAEKHISIAPALPQKYEKKIPESFASGYRALAGDLNICSKRGLSERFDSTIGAGSVLMPFGGKYQLTPIQAMVNKIPVMNGKVDTCSMMAWGYNPEIATASPFHGAYLAVVESVSKLVAHGASFEKIYLTFQEYFEKPNRDPARWGKPFAALLGAFEAQLELGIAAVGGKDSMSGSFEHINVPPTLVSFAVKTEKLENIISNEFKKTGSRVVLLKPEYDEKWLPKTESLISVYNEVARLVREKKALAVSTLTYGGAAEAILKMCLGNKLGFRYNHIPLGELFENAYGSFVIELSENAENIGTLIGYTDENASISRGEEKLSLDELTGIYENKLESVYPSYTGDKKADAKVYEAYKFNSRNLHRPIKLVTNPRVLIPVFPGTNCEYDTARAFAKVGGDPQIFVINNMSPSAISESVSEFAKQVGKSQIIFIPGGFSGGDEPDGSGKFITAFFRNAEVKESVNKLITAGDGLMCGICNGFQALIKLGLVPYGEIIDTTEDCATLTYNTIGRHQSRLVRTRVASVLSPWFSACEVGDIYTVPISHGEGRFYASDSLIASLASDGRIATQYVDLEGNPTDSILYNPNNSAHAIEGITSPDGRVLGKMGHSERIGDDLYKNVDGRYDMGIFASAMKYYDI